MMVVSLIFLCLPNVLFIVSSRGGGVLFHVFL